MNDLDNQLITNESNNGGLTSLERMGIPSPYYHKMHTIGGHTMWVTSVLFSKNGKYIYSGGEDKKVIVWDRNTQKKILEHSDIHTGWVYYLCENAEENLLLSASNREAVLWDLSKNKIITRSQYSKDTIKDIFLYNSNYIIVSYSTKPLSVSIKDINGNVLKIFQGFIEEADYPSISSVAFNGNTFLIGDNSGYMQAFDYFSGKLVFQSKIHKSVVESIAFLNSNFDFVTTGSSDKLLRKFSRDGVCIKSIKVDMPYGIHDIAINNENNDIIACGYHAPIYIFNSETLSLINTLHSHKGLVLTVDCALDGQIASGGSDYKLIIHQLHPHNFEVLTGHTAPIKTVSLSNNSNLILAGSVNETNTITDIYSGKNICNFNHQVHWSLSSDFSMDCKLCAVSSYDRRITLYHVEKKRHLLTQFIDSSTYNLKFLNNNHIVYYISEPSTIHVWDIYNNTDRVLLILEKQVLSNTIKFDPSGYVIYATSDSKIRIFNLFNNEDNYISDLSSSPVNIYLCQSVNFLYVFTKNHEINIYNYINLKRIHIIKYQKSIGKTLAINSKKMISVQYIIDDKKKGYLFLWDIVNMKKIVDFQNYNQYTITEAFFHLDELIMTVSQDNTFSFFGIEDGKLRGSMFHLEYGYLWTTPPDKIAPNGWLWTNRPDLISILKKQEDGKEPIPVTQDDPLFTEYMNEWNKQDRVMQRIHNYDEYKESVIRITGMKTKYMIENVKKHNNTLRMLTHNNIPSEKDKQ